jgi:hypothetical protein
LGNKILNKYHQATSSKVGCPHYEFNYRSKVEDDPQENQGISKDIKDTIQERMKI